jgi:hypothetical protein
MIETARLDSSNEMSLVWSSWTSVCRGESDSNKRWHRYITMRGTLVREHSISLLTVDINRVSDESTIRIDQIPLNHYATDATIAAEQRALS